MTIQISKIQLRRGLQSDLPGAATLGLDVGEVAFTTDTNRLFVGTDTTPSGSAALVSRIHTVQSPTTGGFPFGNVEILTEFSPTNQVVFDSEARNITTAFLVSAPLAITGPNAWATVMVAAVSGYAAPPQTVPWAFNAQSPSSQFASAQISYHMLDQTTGTPLRTGRLTLFFQPPTPPSVIDAAIANPYAGIPANGLPADPNLRYGLVAFKAVVVPPQNEIQLQYQITLAGVTLPVPVLYFRVEQPALLGSAPNAPMLPPVGNAVSMPVSNAVSNASGTPIITVQAGAIPYDIMGDILDPLAAGEVFFSFVFVRRVSFPAGLGSSRAVCQTAPTGSVTLPIMINGSTIGGIGFAASEVAGTFTFPSNTIVNPGDVLTLAGPTPIDATFSTVSYTLSGTIT